MLLPLDTFGWNGLAATVIRHSLPCDYCKATLESFCRRCGRRLRQTEHVSRLAYVDLDAYCGACGVRKHVGTPCPPIVSSPVADDDTMPA